MQNEGAYSLVVSVCMGEYEFLRRNVIPKCTVHNIFIKWWSKKKVKTPLSNWGTYEYTCGRPWKMEANAGGKEGSVCS